MIKSNNNLLSKKNRGFTLTELVIVIAVIAVLAAVLIPTFIGIANNAKISADVQTAKNATTVATNKTEIQDVYNAIVEDGNVDIFSSQSGGRFAYEASTRQFVLLNSKMEIVDNKNASSANTKQLWFFVKNNEGIVSADSIKDTTMFVNYFLCNDYSGNFNLPTLSSFETGNSKLTGSVNVGNASNAIQTTGTISMGGNIDGNITMNIPNADVNQKGFIKSMNVIAVKNGTLNITGRVDDVQVAKGKVDVKQGAFVKNIIISENPDVINIESRGFIEAIKPATNTTIPADKVTLNIQAGIVQSVDSNVQKHAESFESSSSIQISNAKELANFRDQVNAGSTFEGVTVQLTDNIVLEGAWTPIGAFFRDNYNVLEGKTMSFSGIFDGNNKKISGLTNNGFDVTKYPAMYGEVSSTLEGKKEFAYGLFGVVTNATIKNLTVENPQINIPTGSNIYYGDSVGAVVGFASGNLTMENVQVLGGNVVAYDSVGAVVGFASGNLTMENVQVLGGNVVAYDSVGGLVGRIYQVDSVRFDNCKNTATVSGNAKIGGIVGYAGGKIIDTLAKTVQFTGCVNEGNVTAEMTQLDKNKVVYAGGIMAYVNSSSLVVEISNCTVSGTIKAVFSVQNETPTGVKAGAIIGKRPETNLISEIGNNTANVTIIPANN